MTTRSLSRVERLYHAALQRPPSERDAFVSERAEGDAKLLREVRSLLAVEADAQRLLAQPVGEAATARLSALPGTTLGHYEIVELIGAGGMAEVYRARDTRLGRDVALKLLPEVFAADPERLAQLEREARALAALSHPGIAAIHGIEESAGVRFLVLERVEGETLAERLLRGALPPREALALGMQVAEALAAAHEHGILHRDVKPSNVQVTPEGRAKLLDFGLAKVWAPGPAETGAGETATRPGAILGTAPYMSPEQARGESLDRRADVWSFGCVLFEMLAGERAFPGETTSDAIAKVLQAEPRWEALPRGTPAPVRSLLRRCLRKERARRLHDLADAALELEEALAGDAHGEEAAGALVPASRARPWGWAVAGLLAVLLAGAMADRFSPPPPAALSGQPVMRSQLELTPGRPLLGRTHASSRTVLALSPDGSLLVWASDPEPGRFMVPGPDAALELRRLDTGEVTRLPGTEGASQPFFSPDGRWIGFFARDGDRWRLRKVRVDDGGLPIDLAELPAWPRGGSWGDGRIYLGLPVFPTDDLGPGLACVGAEGGTLERLTAVDPDREAVHQLPRALPGDRVLLFTAMPHGWGVRSRVEAVRLATGERRVIVEDAADARYLATGRLVFARQGVLMAAPFDPERLELLATPVPVVPGVAQALNRGTDGANSGALQLAVSDTGLLVYAAGGIYEDLPYVLVVADEKGNVEPLPGFDKPLLAPQLHLSPDGRWLAFVERARSGRAWVFDIERQTYTPLSRTGLAGSPRWSPDGERIAMAWSEAGPSGLWLLPAHGSGDWERLAPRGMAPAWSPDGRVLVFWRDGDILLYRFADRQVVPVVADVGVQAYPEVSPDGRWLAYTSDETGRQEVYVTSFPGREHTLTVSDSFGSGPVWSRDGRRLYYLGEGDPATRRRRLMAVDVRPGSPLSLGRPVTLFESPRGTSMMRPMRYYEILPDGRFLFGVIEGWEERKPSPRITRLELVQGWHAELERLSPTGRWRPAPRGARTAGVRRDVAEEGTKEAREAAPRSSDADVLGRSQSEEGPRTSAAAQRKPGRTPSPPSSTM